MTNPTVTGDTLVITFEPNLRSLFFAQVQLSLTLESVLKSSSYLDLTALAELTREQALKLLAGSGVKDELSESREEVIARLIGEATQHQKVASVIAPELQDKEIESSGQTGSLSSRTSWLVCYLEKRSSSSPATDMSDSQGV